MMDFEFVRLLSKGRYSDIYLAKNDFYGQFVVKQVDLVSLNRQEKFLIQNEVGINKLFTSGYIVKYLDSFKQEGLFNILLEYCDCSDLEVHIRLCIREGRFFNEKDIIRWTYHLLQSLSVLQDYHIIHRDIKPDNILLKFESNILNAKLSDFKLSHTMLSTSEQINSFTGSPIYMAPEILKHDNYTYLVDIWSLGCVILELCNLSHPYDYENIEEVKDHVFNYDPPKLIQNYSNDLYQIIRNMLIRNPKFRYNSKELLKYPIFDILKSNRSDSRGQRQSISPPSSPRNELHYRTSLPTEAYRLINFINPMLTQSSGFIKNIDRDYTNKSINFKVNDNVYHDNSNISLNNKHHQINKNRRSMCIINDSKKNNSDLSTYFDDNKNIDATIDRKGENNQNHTYVSYNISDFHDITSIDHKVIKNNHNNTNLSIDTNISEIKDPNNETIYNLDISSLSLKKSPPQNSRTNNSINQLKKKHISSAIKKSNIPQYINVPNRKKKNQLGSKVILNSIKLKSVNDRTKLNSYNCQTPRLSRNSSSGQNSLSPKSNIILTKLNRINRITTKYEDKLKSCNSNDGINSSITEKLSSSTIRIYGSSVNSLSRSSSHRTSTNNRCRKPKRLSFHDYDDPFSSDSLTPIFYKIHHNCKKQLSTTKNSSIRTEYSSSGRSSGVSFSIPDKKKSLFKPTRNRPLKVKYASVNRHIESKLSSSQSPFNKIRRSMKFRNS